MPFSLTLGLRRSVQQQPHATAVIFRDRTRTFAQLAERTARLAHALQMLGMKRGDRVAMLANNSDCYLEYLLGVLWGGGVLNPVNVRWSAAEIAWTLDDCDTHVLLVDETFRPLAAQLREKSRSLRTVIDVGAGDPLADASIYEDIIRAATPIEDAGCAGEYLAGVFYTGGTTGFPKGVMLSHRNLGCSALGLAAEGYPTADTVYLHAAPMFHLADGSQTFGLLATGGRHVIIPGFTAEAVLDAIQQHRVASTLLVPTMIQRLADHPRVSSWDAVSLKSILYGAAPIAEGVLDRAMAAFPNAAFVQLYGMTELAPVATILPAKYHTVAGRAAGKLRSAGRAVVTVEIVIANADGAEVDRGTVGEILVRTPQTMQGYWGKPEETSQAVRDGWMHTGDGAYMDEEGFVFIVDRLKDMIVSGGENVYSAEVENAAARHPAVATVAVIGIPDDRWGEAVHAIVILKESCRASEQEIIASCREHIAGYKCPRSVEFRAALPVSGAGKVLKTELRAPFWAGRSRSVS